MLDNCLDMIRDLVAALMLVVRVECRLSEDVRGAYGNDVRLSIANLLFVVSALASECGNVSEGDPFCDFGIEPSEYEGAAKSLPDFLAKCHQLLEATSFSAPFGIPYTAMGVRATTYACLYKAPGATGE
jgi:hypothetical protein